MKSSKSGIGPRPASGSGTAETAPILLSDSMEDRSLAMAPGWGRESELVKRTSGVLVRARILLTASAFPWRFCSTTSSIRPSSLCRRSKADIVSEEQSLATITIFCNTPWLREHSSRRDDTTSARAGDSRAAQRPMVYSAGAFGFRLSSSSASLSPAFTWLQPLLVCLTSRYEARTTAVTAITTTPSKGNSGIPPEEEVEVVEDDGAARTFTDPIMKV